MSFVKSPRIGEAAPLPRFAALGRQVRELMSFGAVGVLAFVVDFVVYNLLRSGPMEHEVLTAKIVSVAVATTVAWLGNRFLTFRERRNGSVLREGILFAVINVIGLFIALLCLFVSHYVFGFTSTLADNISGNIIGLILGTTFRYFAYRLFVFPHPTGVTRNDLAPLDRN